MKKRFLFYVCLVFGGLLFLTSGTIVTATELIWEPINPSFIGGSPLNGSFLLNEAQAQNNTKDDVTKKSALQDFNDTLNRQILYRLSSKLVDAAFGEQGVNPGHYQMGNYIIDVTSDASGLSVHIVDTSTGNDTTVQIPYY